MPDEVSEGEQIRAVGCVSRDEGQEFRPELLIREDRRATRRRSVALPESPVAGTVDEAGEHSPDDGSEGNGFLIAGALRRCRHLRGDTEQPSQCVMNEVWLWLETTVVAEALRTSAWGCATAEALHLTGTVLLVGPPSSSTSGF